MKKLITLLFLINLNLFALDINVIKESFAIGVFHENGAGEKIQHKKSQMKTIMELVFQKLLF